MDSDIAEKVIAYEQEQRIIRNSIDMLLAQYEMEMEDTPWYHNTANCHLYGAIDELESMMEIKKTKADIFCYIRGRLKALDALHNMLSAKLLNLEEISDEEHNIIYSEYIE